MLKITFAPKIRQRKLHLSNHCPQKICKVVFTDGDGNKQHDSVIYTPSFIFGSSIIDFSGKSDK